MLIRSFRVRFLLWNVLLTGAVLAGFGVLTMGLSYRGELERLDSDLLQNALREFQSATRVNFREGVSPLWRSEYGGGAEPVSLALLIRERAGTNVLLQSKAWSAELNASDFADPPLSLLASQQAPPRENREGPFGRLPPPHENMEGPLGHRPLPPELEEGGMPPPPFDGGPSQPGEEFEPPPLEKGAFTSLKLTDGNWRFGVIGQRSLTMIVGVPLQPLQTQMSQLAQVLLIAFLPGLFLVAVSGWILTGRALRPIRRLTQTAEGITARGLDQRLPLTREAEEFNRLSEVFNSMLDRLEKSFRQATRFSADAAHELKTPLAILQGQLEESLREAADDPAHQQLCASLLEEVQRLKGIVRKLLLLSLADAGELRIQREAVDLNVLVENAAEDAGILAPGLTVDFKADAPAIVQGDADLLAQVIQNLVGNAIKYNGDPGWIRLKLDSQPDVIRLVVSNSGAPIPADVQLRIFERFFRGDVSRTRAVEGFGLGLSLSRELARAHGGDLMLERSDEGGTTFVLQLPV